MAADYASAFALRRFGGLEPAAACEASGGWVAGPPDVLGKSSSNRGVDHGQEDQARIVSIAQNHHIAPRIRDRRRHHGGRRRRGIKRAGANDADQSALLQSARHVEPARLQHVIEVTGPHRTVYFAGQTGADANGKVSPDFREQAVQVFENIKTALASVGAGFEHVVKVTAYHTHLDANAAIYREVRASYFKNKAALPGHTLLQISRLANPAYQLELEFIAILPPKA